MSSEAKAYEYMAQGDKKYNARVIFGSKTTQWEDAADLYNKAGNVFKMAKKWEEAGNAFAKAADCHLKLKSKYEAANDFINAGNSLKKSNVSEALRMFKQAVELFTDEGKFSMAAKHTKEIAELCESENDIENAITFFQQAADYFDGENATSSSNQCLLKVAHFSAQLEKYDKAIELYEQVANASLDNSLLKWSVKDYFLKAGLCHLASGDFVGARRAIEKYQELDPSFTQQRECKFLVDLLQACEEHDVEKYTNTVADYDAIQRLDPWKTSVLLKVKNAIKGEDPTL